MHEFKISSNTHRCTERAQTEIRSDSFLWPDIHIVFFSCFWGEIIHISKQIPTHAKTHSYERGHTHTHKCTNALDCQANMNSCENLGLSIFIEIVKYEKCISSMPHVIILNTWGISACDGSKNGTSVWVSELQCVSLCVHLCLWTLPCVLALCSHRVADSVWMFLLCLMSRSQD